MAHSSPVGGAPAAFRRFAGTVLLGTVLPGTVLLGGFWLSPAPARAAECGAPASSERSACVPAADTGTSIGDALEGSLEKPLHAPRGAREYERQLRERTIRRHEERLEREQRDRRLLQERREFREDQLLRRKRDAEERRERRDERDERREQEEHELRKRRGDG